MLLYYGSYMPVERPRLLRPIRKLDFGSGFYTTSSFEQASRWARQVVRRKCDGIPTVTEYELPDIALTALRCLIFPDASHDWLHFVGSNRRDEVIAEALAYDLIIGPVANDTTMPVLRLFFSGIYSEDEAIKRLLPQTLTDQYVFKTQTAIDVLEFCKVVHV